MRSLALWALIAMLLAVVGEGWGQDDCSSVVMIDSLPYTASGSTAGMTDDFHCGANTAPDVIYTFVAPDSGLYRIILCESDYDTKLEVRSGTTCPGDTVLACNNDGCLADSVGGDYEPFSPQSRVLLVGEAGVRYFVIVDGAESTADSGNYVLTISAPSALMTAGVELASVLWPISTPNEYVGMALDCTGRLYFTMHMDPNGPTLYVMNSPTSGIVSAQYPTIEMVSGSPVSVALDEITWDKDRNILWGASTGYFSTPSRIYQVDPTDGSCTYMFDGATSQFVSHCSGLTYDPSDQTLWQTVSKVSTYDIHHYGIVGWQFGVHLGFINPRNSLGNYQPVWGGICDVPTGSMYISANWGATDLVSKSTGQWVSDISHPGWETTGMELGPLVGNSDCVLWEAQIDQNNSSSVWRFVAYQVPPYCSCSDTGRCCYCDGAGIPRCAQGTQAQCTALGGEWLAGSTCDLPCPSHAQVRADVLPLDTLECINGVYTPNPFSLGITISNYGPTTCNNISVIASYISGSGGTATVIGSPVFIPSLSPQTGAAPYLNGQIASATGTGGNICFMIIVSSDCCGPDTVYQCVYIPPCPCPYTDLDSPGAFGGNEAGNNYCGYVSFPGCPDTLCGHIRPPDYTGLPDEDWYTISPPYYPQCTRFVIDIFGNDTPGRHPFGQGLNPIVEIYEANCATLWAYDDDGGSGTDSRLEVCVPSTGDYHIRVTGANDTEGPYILAVACEPCLCGQCCYCDSAVVGCAVTTSAICDQMNGIWTQGLTCNDPCPMIPGIDIDSPGAQAVTCSSGVIVPNPYLVSANIYNHQTTDCQDVSVSLAVSMSSGVTGTVLNSPIYLGNMSGQTGSSVAFNVQLSNINPGGAYICYQMITESAGCCNDSVFICDTIPPCPCPYTDYDFEYPEPGVPQNMDNDSCNTFLLDCGVCGCGEISSAGDVDWYPIYNFGALCNRLILNVYGNDTPLQFPYGKGLNPKIQLYHDDCVSQIAWDDNSGIGNDSYLSACLPTGNYRLKITGVGNSTGPYILCTACEPCSCSAPCDDACDHQLTSLQNWWQLDELSGNTANEGVNQRDGGWINSPVPQPGKVGASLRFNGTNYVSVSSHPLVETGSNSFSLDAWINIDNHPVPAAPMPIAGKTDASGRGFLLYIDILGYLAGWVKDGNVSNDLIAIDPVVVPPGWHFVTMTFTKHDATHPNDVLTLYRCGNVVQQLTAPTNLGPFTNNAPFEIANTQFPFFAKFMGRIDEVELWRRDLRQDEVQALCNTDSFGKCKEFCHLPWDRYLCWLSNTATVGVTLCNFTPYAQTYNWTVSGVTPYTWQCPFVPPVAYSWPPIWGPPTPSVAPGTCVTIPLTITAPPGLGFNDVSCYQVNFTSSSGKTFCCKGSIWGRRRWCFHLNEWEISPLSVRVGADSTFVLSVTNESDSSGVLAYTLDVMSPDPLLPGVMINGLPAGDIYEGTLAVPLGQTGQLPITLQMPEDQPLNMYDLMIGWDESGDNVPEFPLSISVRSEPASAPPPDPANVVIHRGTLGEWRLSWELIPEAAVYNIYSADTPDAPPETWTFVGITSSNSFAISFGPPPAAKKFYFVKAEN